MRRRRHPTPAFPHPSVCFALVHLCTLTFALRTHHPAPHQVFVAGFFPLSNNVSEGAVGRGVLPAVLLAQKHINDNRDVLKGYSLEILWNDTLCNAAVGIKTFFDMVAKEPPKVLIFGAACTQVTDPIAKTSSVWHLNQLSYADTHPMFTSDKYPNLFRMVPSETGFNPTRIELLKRFNWTLVGTLYQKDPRYALAHNKLLTQLELEKIYISESQSVADDVQPALLKLKEKDVRIILGNFDETWALRIFCEVYRLGMHGRKYQWIIVGMYREGWWMNQDPTVSCTIEEISEALDGCLVTDLLPLRTNNVRTISGKTATEYLADYDVWRKGEYSRFHGYAYDGMWTMALAIQNVSQRLHMDGHGNRLKRSLRDFQYRNKGWGNIFWEALQGTDFEGVTGPVKFVDNDRSGYIVVKQFNKNIENKLVRVGVYDGTAKVLDLDESLIVWRGTGPPVAKVLYVHEHTRVSITIYSALASVASLGIVLAIIFLTINVRYRHQRFIKMSSPYLNNLIIIGCVLTYTSVILLGLDSDLTSPESLPYVCTVRSWVLMSGFTLAFGSMFSKTWRVHTIFTNIKLNKKAITDYQLFAVVGVLLSLDIAIMTTWQVIDPFFRETKKLQPVPSPTNEDISVIPEVEYCRSEKMSYFLGAIYVYKGLLMVIGCFLAWETRHVSIPALNDSKYVGMSVYNVVIMCVMGAAISSILSEQQNAAFILISIFIIFCTTTTLCLVFVPKVVELKRNPRGTETRIRSALQPSMKKRRDSENSADVLRHLQEQNLQYKRLLKEKDLQLRNLMKQLGEDVSEILSSDVHSKLRFPRIVEILRVEATSSMSDEEDRTSVISMNSSHDGEVALLTSEMLMSRNRVRVSSTETPSESSPVRVTSPEATNHKPEKVNWANAMNAAEDACSLGGAADSVALIEFSPVMRKPASGGHKTRTRRASGEAIIKVTFDEDPSSPPVYI